MRGQFVFAGPFHRCEAQQAGVIAEIDRDGGFALSLLCPADEPGDQHDGPLGPVGGGFGGEPQYRFVKPCLADRELRRMDANGKAAGAGIDVVAAERPLPRTSNLRLESSARRCAGITVPSRSVSRTPAGQSAHISAIPYVSEATKDISASPIAGVNPAFRECRQAIMA